MKRGDCMSSDCCGMYDMQKERINKINQNYKEKLGGI